MCVVFMLVPDDMWGTRLPLLHIYEQRESISLLLIQLETSDMYNVYRTTVE